MIAQARCGDTLSAIEPALWLYKRADELQKESGAKVATGCGFEAARLYLSACSGFALASEHLQNADKSKQLQRALAAVKKAVDSGFRDAGYLASDPDLASLQSLEEYKELVSAL